MVMHGNDRYSLGSSQMVEESFGFCFRLAKSQRLKLEIENSAENENTGQFRALLTE